MKILEQPEGIYPYYVKYRDGNLLYYEIWARLDFNHYVAVPIYANTLERMNPQKSRYIFNCDTIFPVTEEMDARIRANLKDKPLPTSEN